MVTMTFPFFPAHTRARLQCCPIKVLAGGSSASAQCASLPESYLYCNTKLLISQCTRFSLSDQPLFSHSHAFSGDAPRRNNLHPSWLPPLPIDTMCHLHRRSTPMHYEASPFFVVPSTHRVLPFRRPIATDASSSLLCYLMKRGWLPPFSRSCRAPPPPLAFSSYRGGGSSLSQLRLVPLADLARC